VRVRAFYLKIWLEDEVAHLNECPWEEDLSYAQVGLKRAEAGVDRSYAQTRTSYLDIQTFLEYLNVIH